MTLRQFKVVVNPRTLHFGPRITIVDLMVDVKKTIDIPEGKHPIIHASQYLESIGFNIFGHAYAIRMDGIRILSDSMELPLK